MGFRVTDAFRASPTQHHDCWLDLRARLTELADEPARATAHQVRRVRRQLRFDRHVERVLQRLVREARRSPSRMRRRAQRAGRYTAAGEKLRQSGGDTRAGKGVRGGGGGGDGRPCGSSPFQPCPSPPAPQPLRAPPVSGPRACGRSSLVLSSLLASRPRIQGRVPPTRRF